MKETAGLRCSKDNWFVCVDIEVLRDWVLSLEAKLVFSVLCMIAGFGERSCTPDDEEVANLADVSMRTLYRAYNELESRGVISRNGWFVQLIGYNAPCYNKEEER